MLNEVRSELHYMINWHIGVQHGFGLSTGKDGKYFKRYLSPELFAQYASTYSGADYDEVWRSVSALSIRQGEEDGMRIYLGMVKEYEC